MRMMLVCAIVCFSVCSSLLTQAETVFIKGEAARTLFICDERGDFDCWFAEGQSYCLLNLSDTSEINALPPMQLVIRGSVASQIYSATRPCYDNDLPQFRYHYGHQGIHCYKTWQGHICWLAIDWPPRFLLTPSVLSTATAD